MILVCTGIPHHDEKNGNRHDEPDLVRAHAPDEDCDPDADAATISRIAPSR